MRDQSNKYFVQGFFISTSVKEKSISLFLISGKILDVTISCT